MRHLFVMRHAKAKPGSDDLADHQRALRRRGHRQATAMAPLLERWGALDGEIHVSSARRTRQTLEAIDAALPGLALRQRTRMDDALYTFAGDALRDWLMALPTTADHVLLIGHNPALLELVRWLCREAPQTLPTGSLVHLRLPDSPWQALEPHCAEQVASLRPEQASHALFKRKAPSSPSLKGASLADRVHAQLDHQLRLIRALESGVIAGVDPEFLHQYRVNLRRSRAIGESVLATVEVPGLKKRLKRLKRRAQATSDLRDLDVFLESLSAASSPLVGACREPLVRWLQHRREAQQVELRQQLALPGYAEEMQAWQAFLASRGFHKALAGLSAKGIGSVLAQRMADHDEALSRLHAGSDDKAFHDLRKGVKRIRYLAELAPRQHRDLLARLKRRQALLGDLQDLCTRQAWIATFMGEAGVAPDERADGERWLAMLEQHKQALRQDIMAEAPLVSARGR